MTSTDTLLDSGSSHDPEVGLHAVAALRRLVEQLEDLQVAHARELGWSWADIAAVVGVSKQAVHKEARRTGDVRRRAEVVMFERFTNEARAVVVRAQEQARALGQSEIRPEHLLLGVLGGDDTSARVLAELGVRRDDVVRALALPKISDGDALRSIGVDLEAVRRQIEAAFGPGALDRPQPERETAPGRRGLLHLRRRAELSGHLRLSDASKRVLQQSLRQAVSLQSIAIGSGHLLLGMLDDDLDPAAQMLVGLGVCLQDVREQVRAWLRTAA